MYYHVRMFSLQVFIQGQVLSALDAQHYSYNVYMPPSVTICVLRPFVLMYCVALCDL